MTIDKSFKIGITTSLIGSVVFLYLLDPILKLLSNLFFFLSDEVSSYFVDQLYREISVGRTDYSLTQMTIFILLFTSLISILLLRKIVKSRPPKDQNIPEKNSSLVKSVWITKILPLVFVIIINIFGVLQLVSSHIKVSSINTFDQRIRILTPYISELERQLLISRFSSMTTYNNYRKIMHDLETLATNNNIILPEQLFTYTY